MLSQGTRLTAKAPMQFKAAGGRMINVAQGDAFVVTANERTHSRTVPAGAVLIARGRSAAIGTGHCMSAESVGQYFDVA